MIVNLLTEGESIVVNDDIIVEVVEIDGDHVQLGLELPPNIPVSRGEVFEALRQTE